MMYIIFITVLVACCLVTYKLGTKTTYLLGYVDGYNDGCDDTEDQQCETVHESKIVTETWPSYENPKVTYEVRMKMN